MERLRVIVKGSSWNHRWQQRTFFRERVWFSLQDDNWRRKTKFNIWSAVILIWDHLRVAYWCLKQTRPDWKVHCCLNGLILEVSAVKIRSFVLLERKPRQHIKIHQKLKEPWEHDATSRRKGGKARQAHKFLPAIWKEIGNSQDSVQTHVLCISLQDVAETTKVAEKGRQN